jgi:hypothetical protein
VSLSTNGPEETVDAVRALAACPELRSVRFTALRFGDARHSRCR